MSEGRIVPYTIVDKENGTFDLLQGTLLVGTFPSREDAENAEKLAKDRHK